MTAFSINANLLKGVSMFASSDKARPALHGVAVWLDAEGQGVIEHVVATDSYQMVIAEHRGKGTAWTAPTGDPHVFIPAELIARAPKVDKKWPYLAVEDDDNGQVTLSNGDTVASGRYPLMDYPKVDGLVTSKDNMVFRDEGWDAIGFDAKFMERTGKAVKTMFGSKSALPIRFAGHGAGSGKHAPTFWEASGLLDGEHDDKDTSVWSLLVLWMPVRVQS